MKKRVLVIPDIHGETFWKEPVQKYIDQVDRIIFLGDYLDPYRQFEDEYNPDTVFNNLMDIVNLKLNNKDKVVLLKGNHDFHYTSKRAMELACASRCDKRNWHKFNKLFNDYDGLFKLAHLESIKGITYLFSHAGVTTYWINQVNAKLWKMNDRDVSIADQAIIDKINDLDYDLEGQNMLAIIGKYRTIIGEKTGSILWADIEEHTFPVAPKAYGLNKVFQVFGHSRLDKNKVDLIEFENIALIDSEQCFMIDEGIDEKIITLSDYEKK